jgi:hypothetical protein
MLMVAITATFSAPKHADLFESYLLHRERALAGDIPNRWQPKYSFYDHPRFNCVTGRALKTVEDYAEMALGEIESVGVKKIDVTLERAEVVSNREGCYRLFDSTDSKAVVLLNGDFVVNALYGTGWSKVNRDKAQANLELTFKHEFRHHLDRVFGMHAFKIIKALAYENPLDTDGALSTSRYFLNHFVKLRTEGYASFSPTLMVASREDPNLSHERSVKGAEYRSNLFLNRMRKNRRNMDKVHASFHELDRVTIGQVRDRIHPGGVHSLGLEGSWSTYIQGDYMFATIAIAEVMRGGGSLVDVFSDFSIPRDVYLNVSKNVRKQTSFAEFFDMYYDAVGKIDLPEETVIVTPKQVQPLLDFEETHA